MEKYFNVTGLCVPKKHYMVDIGRQLREIRALVDAGAYFTMNRGRQYGKTTTLHALTKLLSGTYHVVSLDFQALGNDKFSNESVFAKAFAKMFLRAIYMQESSYENGYRTALDHLQITAAETSGEFHLMELFEELLAICEAASKPLVLMIDEVDSAANNQIFLDFLAQLRFYYLEREAVGTVTFHSVILAGVHDVRHLKRKLRPEEEQKVNSPWNIAAKFEVDMSFNKDQISGMLKEYEKDHGYGISVIEAADWVYEYTSGYPYLVSALCKLMDEEIPKQSGFSRETAWSREGFLTALRMILTEESTLFDSLMGKLADYPELDAVLKKLLFTGAKISYNADNPELNIAKMFGFIKNQEGAVAIANRIFETRLYNHYLTVSELQGTEIVDASQRDCSQFLVEGHLNMRHILEKFVEHFHELYPNPTERFLEDMGRRLFLLYLRPIINGTGNYYIEAQTRDLGRTDVIVDYHGEQFVIETKIWRGNEYHKRGEQQLMEYLDSYHLSVGYMLSFNFNQKKQVGIREIVLGDKKLIEAVV